MSTHKLTFSDEQRYYISFYGLPRIDVTEAIKELMDEEYKRGREDGFTAGSAAAYDQIEAMQKAHPGATISIKRPRPTNRGFQNE